MIKLMFYGIGNSAEKREGVKQDLWTKYNIIRIKDNIEIDN